MSMATASHRCKPPLFTDDLTAAWHIHGRFPYVPLLYVVELAAGLDTHEPFLYTLELVGVQGAQDTLLAILTDTPLQDACFRL